MEVIMMKYLSIIVLTVPLFSMQVPEQPMNIYGQDDDFRYAMQLSLVDFQDQQDIAYAIALSEEARIAQDNELAADEMALVTALIASQQLARSDNTATSTLPKSPSTTAIQEEAPICSICNDETKIKKQLGLTKCCKNILCYACERSMAQELVAQHNMWQDPAVAAEFAEANGHLPSRGKFTPACPFCRKDLDLNPLEK